MTKREARAQARTLRAALDMQAVGRGMAAVLFPLPCWAVAGTVLAFARALGEYGATSMIAGYTPGKTATISTTVYQLWQTNNDVLATKWVLVNIAISAVVLLAVNMLERRDFLTDASKARRARR